MKRCLCWLVLVLGLTSPAQARRLSAERAWTELVSELSPIVGLRGRELVFTDVFDRHNFAIAIGVDRSGSFTDQGQLQCVRRMLVGDFFRPWKLLVPGDRILLFSFSSKVEVANAIELSLVPSEYVSQIYRLQELVPFGASQDVGTDVAGACAAAYEWLSVQWQRGARHLLMLIFSDFVQDAAPGTLPGPPEFPRALSFGLPQGVGAERALFPGGLVPVRWYVVAAAQDEAADLINFRVGDQTINSRTTLIDNRAALGDESRESEYRVSGQVVHPDGTPVAGIMVTGGPGLSAPTGNDGSFWIPLPGPGRYRIRPEVVDAECRPPHVEFELTQNFRTKSGVTFVVCPSGGMGIVVRVVGSEETSPVVKASVQVSRPGDGTVAVGATDGHGVCQLPVQAAGQYNVTVSKGGKTASQGVRVSERSRWPEVRFVLEGVAAGSGTASGMLAAIIALAATILMGAYWLPKSHVQLSIAGDEEAVARMIVSRRPRGRRIIGGQGGEFSQRLPSPVAEVFLRWPARPAVRILDTDEDVVARFTAGASGTDYETEIEGPVELEVRQHEGQTIRLRLVKLTREGHRVDVGSRLEEGLWESTEGSGSARSTSDEQTTGEDPWAL